MAEKKNIPGKSSELRMRAEEKAAQSQNNAGALSSMETHNLLHELRVHQIELEIQNEELRNSQAELEAARERYFDLYDLAPVGYCTISEKGLIVEANLNASNLLGVSRNTLIGRLFSSFILKEDQSLYYQHRRKLIQAGEPQGCELRLIKQDGVLFWAHLTASAAQKTEDGAPLFRVVLSDITGRKLAEEALQRKEHDLSESQRIAHVGSWRLDLKTNQVVWTEELYHMYGFDPSLPPPPYTEHMKLFTPESWKRLSTAIARTKDTGIPYTLELETVRKDGSKGWMWVLGEADVDSAGKKVGLWGAAQDITERKREQESLRESELKFRTLVEVSSSGIWSTDAAGLNTYVSPRWSEITGMSEADATGRGWASGLHPDDRIPVRTGWEEAANVAQPYVSEFRFVRPDGRLVWVLCQASPLMVGGEITEWIGTITDITARKNAEENLRESEARFRSLFENHAAVKLIINLATGAIIDVNPAAANYYGWSRETMRQMRIQDINTLSPQEVEREMQVAAEEHRNYFEFRHRRADGSIRDVAVFSSNVATPGNAAILYSVVNDITESKQSESLLAFLARSCANPASGDFFQMLARYISETLDMGFVCIDRLDGDNLTAHTEAVYSNGRFEDNVSYALKDTPCGEVVGKQVCCFPASIKTLFPNDAVLQQMAAESYIGITLWSHDGRPIGLIAVIGARPLTRRSQAESILRLVGVRAAAELERKLAEERLLHAYRQMESIIEATRVGTWEWNIQTGATIFNEEWARIIGYTLNELEPVSIKTWETFTHPDDLKKSDELLKRHFAGELQYYDCDCRIRHKNGQWIWINDRGRVITRTADGKPLMMLGIHTDITERKQIEHQQTATLEILDTLNRTNDLQKAVHHILEIIQRTTGVEAAAIRLASEGDFHYYSQIGFNEQFIRLENSLCCRNPDGTIQLDPTGRPLLECTCGLILSGRTDPSNPLFTPAGSAWTNDAQQFRGIHPDTDPRLHPRNRCIHEGYRSVALIPIRIGDTIGGLLQLNDHEPNRFTPELIAFLEDLGPSIGIAITQRRAQEQLRLSVERYQLVTTGSAGGIWDWDILKHRVHYSDRWKALHGYAEHEIDDREEHWKQGIHPDDLPRVMAALEKHFARKTKHFEEEYRIRLKDRTYLWVLDRGVAIFNADGQPVRMAGSEFDITERKRAEEELQMRYEQLQRWQRTTVGREMRMIALKQEVNSLCRAAGLPEHYAVKTPSELSPPESEPVLTSNKEGEVS